MYVEPGEAVALNAGYLVTTVLDKVENGITTLILDASAACHMPDVLEMPYTPPLRGGLKISDMEDEYGIDKDIEIDFDMDVKKVYGNRRRMEDTDTDCHLIHVLQEIS